MSCTHTFLIADDHPLYRRALVGVLKQHFPNVQCLEAESIPQLDTLLLSVQADIILLDLNIPDSNGFETIINLKNDFPKTSIVVMSGQEDSNTVKQVMRLGASGFLPKSAAVENMVEAINQILKGQRWTPSFIELDKEIQDNKVTRLTPRQHKILTMFAKGLLNKQIAYELEVSEATVKAHATAIFLKLDVKTRTQAVIAFQENLRS